MSKQVTGWHCDKCNKDLFASVNHVVVRCPFCSSEEMFPEYLSEVEFIDTVELDEAQTGSISS